MLDTFRNGVIDSQFLRKVSKSEYRQGVRISITTEYWDTCNEQLLLIARHIYHGILSKFTEKEQ